MNDHEIARALAGAAAGIQASPDPSRLRAGMVRLDRIRRIRMAGAAGALGAVVVLGVFVAIPRDEAPVDVRDQPGSDLESGAPDLEPAGIDDATTETSTTTTMASDIGDAPHLLSAPLPTVPAPAAVVTTTVPPSTTAPPPTTTAAPRPSTTTTTTAPSSFTAASTYGSCAEDPPYDEYHGEAAPGATVTITSAWSDPTSVVADGDGSWYLRVEFPDAPVGETFTVIAGDGTTSVGLPFIRTA